MFSLSAKTREKLGKQISQLRGNSILPGVLYGPKVKNQAIELDLKEFEKVYQSAGESSLISLKVDNKEFPVLIHEIQKDPVSRKIIHVDFYQPILTEKVEATVPLVFEGEAPAIRELGGTLVKDVQEVVVKALPQDLPPEIKVNVENLETFEDEILVKDLKVSEKVEIMKEGNEIVAKVAPPEKVEEELEKPIEEKLEGEPEAEEEKEEGKEKTKEGEASAETLDKEPSEKKD